MTRGETSQIGQRRGQVVGPCWSLNWTNRSVSEIFINSLVTNGLDSYHLGDHSSIKGTSGVILLCACVCVSMKFLLADTKVSDDMLRCVTSHLGIYCLPT